MRLVENRFTYGQSRFDLAESLPQFLESYICQGRLEELCQPKSWRRSCLSRYLLGIPLSVIVEFPNEASDLLVPVTIAVAIADRRAQAYFDGTKSLGGMQPPHHSTDL